MVLFRVLGSWVWDCVQGLGFMLSLGDWSLGVRVGRNRSYSARSFSRLRAEKLRVVTTSECQPCPSTYMNHSLSSLKGVV